MRRQSFLFILALFVITSTIPSVAQAHHIPTGLTVSILNKDGTVERTFETPTANVAGGAKVAVADTGADGVPEIVIGNGLGNEPRVTIYRADGSSVTSFLAYDVAMGYGITVAVCDVDGDGTNEILTGTQYGAGPHVQTFDVSGNTKVAGGFMAYAESFRGGVNISCGDLDDDGRAELVTSPGPSGGPHVRVWNFADGAWSVQNEFFAFAPAEIGGVVTTVHEQTLYVTLQKTANNHVVKSYVIHKGVQEDSEQENNTVTTSSLFTFDDQLVATSTEGGYVANHDFALSLDVPFGSVNADAADIDGDGTTEIIAVPDRLLFSSLTDKKDIIVDLSDQRLYAYENGVLANTFLVSTGKYPFATPLGNHSVLAKLPFVDYTWSYGPGNPNNYALGLVPYNLRIYPHVYIHYAYWHNNFGHPMSHGCINVNLENIKWIYNWGEAGIPVVVQE